MFNNIYNFLNKTIYLVLNIVKKEKLAKLSEHLFINKGWTFFMDQWIYFC